MKDFESTYNHSRNVSVDEAMIPFKGRSSMKQYLTKKPTKRGFKVWVLADSHTGYISRFDVYTGKKEGRTEDGLGASVVKNLCLSLEKSTEQIHYTIINNLTNFLFDCRQHHVYFVKLAPDIIVSSKLIIIINSTHKQSYGFYLT